MHNLITKRYKSSDLEKYIIVFGSKLMNKSISRCEGRTSINRLMFLVYENYILETKGERLTDEIPQVWPMGPMFSKARQYSIENNLIGIKLGTDRFNELENQIPKSMKEDKLLKEVFRNVMYTYGRLDVKDLRSLTTGDCSSWYKAKMDYEGSWGGKIKYKHITRTFI